MDTAAAPPEGFNPQQFADLRSWKYYFLATFTMLVYDWMISFDVEIERIWTRKRNAFTVLWVLVRYLPILMYATASYPLFQTTWSPDRCTPFAVPPTIFVIIAVFSAHVIFMLRTYALYGRTRVILQVLIPLLFIELVLLCYTAFDERLTPLPRGFGCLPGSPRRRQGVITWSAPFVYDLVVFGLTLVKTVSMIRMGTRTPVVHVLLRDGLFYFGIMLVAYLLNIFLYIFASESIQDINAGFSAGMTIVMTSRLILNLRAVAQSGSAAESMTMTNSAGPMRFHAVATILEELSYPPASIETEDTLELEERQRA